MTQFETISPIDGSVYVTRPYANADDVALVLSRATAAQKKWRQVSLEARQDLCRKMVAAFVLNGDEIAEQLSWQMGRPIRYGLGEVNGLAERAIHMIDVAPEALADTALPDKAGLKRFIQRDPLGLVFVIAPWNYPYLTAINAIIPAILAGNAVILKHSAQTPLCAEQLFDAFKAAGFPEGVFQYLHLDHAQVEDLITSPHIHHVAFTGSVAGGRMVEHASAGSFKSVGLELGGKDPSYVRVDANISHAVETIIDGAFFNSGQSCCGIERVYVHESVYDDFVAQAKTLVNAYVLGRSDNQDTTLGPLVKASAADFVRGQIEEAVSAGASALIDESQFPLSKKGSAYLAPQLLIDVDHSMRVMTEESFGPVLGIQKVSNDDEALALMNDSEFGLTASVFTQDHSAGLMLGKALEAGTFFINRCDYLDPALAWTGVKNSGKGCTLSTLGFEHLTRPKSYHLKSV